jgi:hypothetical protein
MTDIDKPSEAPDDKLLSDVEQERVTAWRILRRTYLRVLSEQTGQAIDHLTAQEQESLIERWRSALTHDWHQVCELLMHARTSSEMSVLEHVPDEQREALMQVIHERPDE